MELPAVLTGRRDMPTGIFLNNVKRKKSKKKS